jgi:hypothetical protein
MVAPRFLRGNFDRNSSASIGTPPPPRRRHTRGMSYQISGLDIEPFAHLFTLDDEALAARGARRRIADAKPGFPCRVTLEDAEPGERLVLVNYVHQPTDSPYRASHAIYVRESATHTASYVDEVPAVLRTRTLSVRAFDTKGMLRDADLVDGTDLHATIPRMLAGARTAYLHVHYATPGCYAALVERTS